MITSKRGQFNGLRSEKRVLPPDEPRKKKNPNGTLMLIRFPSLCNAGPRCSQSVKSKRVAYYYGYGYIIG